MKMKKIISVVGARPNFMKIAPIYRAFQAYQDRITHLICHTGQHHDQKMSQVFFDELELPRPDFYLGVGSGSHAEQIAGVMVAFEKVLLEQRPDCIVVVGDVNSTIACSLVASRLGIQIAHVEAGLRSFDRSMPEEVNRLLTDALSDYLFVTEESGLINLKNEGISEEKIFFVGNVMIDSLVYFLPKINRSTILERLPDVEEGEYVLATLHRPSNVDSAADLKRLFDMLGQIAAMKKVILPLHPRTRKNLEKYQLMETVSSDIHCIEPLGYIDFVCLVKNAALIVTDSGGIQEESTYLQTPCVTVRNNTERPVTLTSGTNKLSGTDPEQVIKTVAEVLQNKKAGGTTPPLWDGKAAERICEIIANERTAP